jgi:hypothetical protein
LTEENEFDFLEERGKKKIYITYDWGKQSGWIMRGGKWKTFFAIHVVFAF